MDVLAKQAFIRKKATEHRIKWTRHALNELAAEPISVGDVESALQQAEVIEDYPHLRRFLPDCLVLAFISPERPIHCIVAINDSQDYILIITVYRPTAQEWKNDWRTRK
ncbi:MAG: DUF4258 domain-containing protein [Anaerolineae bacterium]